MATTGAASVTAPLTSPIPSKTDAKQTGKEIQTDSSLILLKQQHSKVVAALNSKELYTKRGKTLKPLTQFLDQALLQPIAVASFKEYIEKTKAIIAQLQSKGPEGALDCIDKNHPVRGQEECTLALQKLLLSRFETILQVIQNPSEQLPCWCDLYRAQKRFAPVIANLQKETKLIWIVTLIDTQFCAKPLFEPKKKERVDYMATLGTKGYIASITAGSLIVFNLDQYIAKPKKEAKEPEPSSAHDPKEEPKEPATSSEQASSTKPILNPENKQENRPDSLQRLFRFGDRQPKTIPFRDRTLGAETKIEDRPREELEAKFNFQYTVNVCYDPNSYKPRTLSYPKLDEFTVLHVLDNISKFNTRFSLEKLVFNERPICFVKNGAEAIPQDAYLGFMPGQLVKKISKKNGGLAAQFAEKKKIFSYIIYDKYCSFLSFPYYAPSRNDIKFHFASVADEAKVAKQNFSISATVYKGYPVYRVRSLRELQPQDFLAEDEEEVEDMIQRDFQYYGRQPQVLFRDGTPVPRQFWTRLRVDFVFKFEDGSGAEFYVRGIDREAMLKHHHKYINIICEDPDIQPLMRTEDAQRLLKDDPNSRFFIIDRVKWSLYFVKIRATPKSVAESKEAVLAPTPAEENPVVDDVRSKIILQLNTISREVFTGQYSWRYLSILNRIYICADDEPELTEMVTAIHHHLRSQIKTATTGYTYNYSPITFIDEEPSQALLDKLLKIEPMEKPNPGAKTTLSLGV